MTVGEVLVSVRKFDGRPHRHRPMARPREDEQGVRLGAQVGTVYSKGDVGPVCTTEEPQIMLFPRDAWWTAQVTMVDLDLIRCVVARNPWSTSAPDPESVHISSGGT
ncbi:hypothetical protein QFZ22_009744 [Streptomyces canus]|uniref:Uncharacterized protein n=1 Tax=Streptomyces canus TaxID=58343 RepID=A0AAW8FXB1_9ACTN|nr:hypothetical protein [Streptomyces canus]MDQ0913672.1 hypothetical protein [Streptomyces canus]